MNVFGFQMTRLLGPSETEAAGDPAPAISMASYRDYADSARYSLAASQSKRNPEPTSLTDPVQGDALLDTLIAKLSRNRCTLLPPVRIRAHVRALGQGTPAVVSALGRLAAGVRWTCRVLASLSSP